MNDLLLAVVFSLISNNYLASSVIWWMNFSSRIRIRHELNTRTVTATQSIKYCKKQEHSASFVLFWLYFFRLFNDHLMIYLFDQRLRVNFQSFFVDSVSIPRPNVIGTTLTTRIRQRKLSGNDKVVVWQQKAKGGCVR